MSGTPLARKRSGFFGVTTFQLHFQFAKFQNMRAGHNPALVQCQFDN